jgi:hypothetical protein
MRKRSKGLRTRLVPWRLPIIRLNTHWRVRSSRYRWRHWTPRPRTKIRLSAYRLYYISRRRCWDRRARAAGFRVIKSGLWHDPATDVVYVQTPTGFDDVSGYVRPA